MMRINTYRFFITVFMVIGFMSLLKPVYSQDTLERIRIYEVPNLGSNRPTGVRFIHSYHAMDSLDLFIDIADKDFIGLVEKIDLGKEVSSTYKGFGEEEDWIYLFLEYSNSDNNKSITIKYNTSCLQYMIVGENIYEIDKSLIRELEKYIKDKQYKKELKKHFKCG